MDYSNKSQDEAENLLDWKYKLKRRIENFLLPRQRRLDEIAIEKTKIKSLIDRGNRMKSMIEDDEKILGRRYWKGRGRST